MSALPKLPKGTCGTCFGTGYILCATSAFRRDGYRRERCGLCSGSGKSTYRDDPAYRRWQWQARGERLPA
jgi:hypothetical protein